MITYSAFFSYRTVFKIFLFLFLLFQTLTLSSQNDSLKQKTVGSKEGYITYADTLITLRMNVNNEYVYFKQKGDNFSYDLRPNISLSSRIAFTYRFLSFGIGFTPKFIPGNNDDAEQGKTEAISLGFTINTSHFIQDLQYGKVKGFYLNNTADFESGWDESQDPYFQLPNIKIVQYSGSTSYRFNPNFSLKAIRSQSEIQLKSCGSFIPSLSYSYYEIDNQDPDNNQQQSQKSNNFESLLNAGYFYTFVLNSKFYIAAGIIPGIGFNHTNLTSRMVNGDVHTFYNDLVLRSRETAGLGYNTKKLFAGAEFSIANSFRNMNQTSVRLETTRVFFQIFLGYRFVAPRFLRHETDVVKEAVPVKFQKLLE